MEFGNNDESYLQVGDKAGHDYKIDKGIISSKKTDENDFEYIFR